MGVGVVGLGAVFFNICHVMCRPICVGILQIYIGLVSLVCVSAWVGVQCASIDEFECMGQSVFF